MDLKDTVVVTDEALPQFQIHNERNRQRLPNQRPLLLACLTTIVIVLWTLQPRTTTYRFPKSDPKHRLIQSQIPPISLKDIPAHLENFQHCSINALRSDTSLDFLATAHPLTINEFVARRDRLAQALVADGLDAFLVEPGYTFKYYVNVSQPDWEVWEPEERPFVMVVKPEKDSGGQIRANTTFLVPSFEAERARLLRMPFEYEIELVTYEEHWNPYVTLRSSRIFESSTTDAKPRIMVDDEMRDFISRGFYKNGFDVVGIGGEVERVRQTKSPAEIGILRAVNTGTVESLRATRKCLTQGLTENEVMMVLDNTMRSAGLDPFFDIVLFDEDASNPHGGTEGSKTLEMDTMVLIDVGSHLYGYSSDICRSFFPPFFPQPDKDGQFERLSSNVKEKLRDIVLAAQSVSLERLHENATAASVDLAARHVIDNAGYGAYFTHRVGHGIGIKAHESPYLNKGNVDTTLKAGMTFTSEPGIYIVGGFGVRHEDVLLVLEEGRPEVLTGRRAIDAWHP